MANYVKFRKGSLQAYQNLALKDDDTLYFIVDQDDDNVQLYLGPTLISGGEISDLSIGDLQDTSIGGLADKQILVYDSNAGAWVNTNYRNLIEEFVGATENSAGVSGLVPAPGEGNTNLFLRSDGEWVSIEQPDNEITLTGENPISVDENGVIKLLTDNTTIGIIEKGLSIVGFEDANVGAIPTKTENGLEWIVPDNSQITTLTATVEAIDAKVDSLKTIVGEQSVYDDNGTEVTPASGLCADIINLNNSIENINDNLSVALDDIEEVKNTIGEMNEDISQVKDNIITVNATLGSLSENKADKSLVYTKEEVDSVIATAIAGAEHLKRTVVAGIETIDKNAEGAEQYIYMVPNDKGTYDEYMIIDGELEKVGDWETDLTNYVTKTDLKNSTDLLSAQLETKADIIYYQITNEETGEIEQVPGAFLSPEDEEKLSALVIDKDGNVGISGTVNADNVSGLGSWITENGSTHITNLGESNLSQNVVDKLNFITSVNGTNFEILNKELNLKTISINKVDNLQNILNQKLNASDINLEQFEYVDNKLNIKTIDISKVNNLETLLNGKASASSVVDITNTLNNYTTLTDARLDALEDAITWKDI